MHPYDVDSRVKNETESLRSSYEVTVFCLYSNKHNDNLRDGIKISRHGLKGGNNILRYLSAYVGIFFKIIFSKYHLIHAHDFNALPLAFMLSKFKRITLIYDSHELWSESHHSINNLFILKISKVIEATFARHADLVVTVSDSIGEYLKRLFHNENVKVIRNIPSYTQEGEYDLFREELLLDQETPIFLYQGLVSKERGVELIFEAVRKIPDHYKFYFIFLGSGPYLPILKNKIIQYNLEDRMFIREEVAQDILLRYTSSADIGVHALDRSCLNHEYCLPNKIFEYLHAGIGIVCPDLYELNNFMKISKAGITYASGESASLTKTLEFLLKDKSEIEALKSYSEKAKSSFNWSIEEKKLLNLYTEILN